MIQIFNFYLSDSEKYISAYADQNHAPSFTGVQLELADDSHYIIKDTKNQ